MNYTFELLGISPVIYLFRQQQLTMQEELDGELEYLGVRKCTLDTFVASVEKISVQKHWHPQLVINAVVDFWVNNPQAIQYWSNRLEDAGLENLLLARVGRLEALRNTFESLFHRQP